MVPGLGGDSNSRGPEWWPKLLAAVEKSYASDKALAKKKFVDSRKALNLDVSNETFDELIGFVKGSPIVIAMPMTIFESSKTLACGIMNYDQCRKLMMDTNDDALDSVLSEYAVRREKASKLRAQAEAYIASLSGIAPEQFLESDRPIYGFVDYPRMSAYMISGYGELEVVLKRSVDEFATLTAGDSHDLMSDGQFNVATYNRPFRLFTDPSPHSTSNKLSQGLVAMVEAQIWAALSFGNDVSHIRLSHQGIQNIAEKRGLPSGSREDRYLAYGRLFDKAYGFATQHGLTFQDENGEQWTKLEFQQSLDIHSNYGFFHWLYDSFCNFAAAFAKLTGTSTDIKNAQGLWSVAPGT